MAAPTPFKTDQSAENKGKKQAEKNCKVGHNATTYTRSFLIVMAHSSGVVFFRLAREAESCCRCLDYY